MSSLAAGHKTLVPALVQGAEGPGRDDIIVFAGGVIPAQDYDAPVHAGAKAVSVRAPASRIPPRRCWKKSARRVPKPG